jgi:hypothetical protein
VLTNAGMLVVDDVVVYSSAGKLESIYTVFDAAVHIASYYE